MNTELKNRKTTTYIKKDVALACGGDADAFGRLYELYADEMYRYAFWYLGVRELAEDAVSDAVVNAFVSIRSLRNPDAFKQWIFRILSNCCKACLTEKIRSRSHTVLEKADLQGLSDGLTESTELWEAVRQLEELDREILLLCTIAGYTSKQVGEMLSMPSGTVRSRLSRTVSRLRGVLQIR